MLRLSAPASVWLALLVVAGQGTHNAAALAEAGADSTCSAGRRCGKSHTPAELVSLEEERSIQSEDSSVHLLQTSVGVASRVAPLSFAEIIRDNIGLYPEFNNATDGVTTGAEIIGVAANQAGDMLAFQSAVVTHTGITVSCVCIFLVLRKRYPSMYQHNSEIYDKLKQQPLAMTDSLLDPIYVSLKVKLDDVVEVAGLDHAMLVAFSQFTIQLMLALGLPALCILSPLYYFAGGGAAGEDHLSWFGFGNVRQGNDVTWVTGIFVWYVVVVTQMLVFRWHSREYIPRRQLWLMKMPEPRCNTVLVENIPDDYQNEAKLGEFFGDIFGPGSVQKAVIVRDTSELLKAMKARDQRYQELQQAEFEYFTHGSANPGAAEQASAGWESKRQGLENTVKDAEVNVEKLRAAATASTTNVSSSAFVTFSDQKQSIMALSMRYTEDDEEFMVSVPPDPSDVIYSDLQVDWRVEDVTELTGYACIAALFFGFMPIVTGITAITNLESLGQRFPLIATFADNHEGFKSLWDGLMGSAGLTIFMSFLPTFLVMIFTKFFALRAEAWLQHRIQQWYFYFLVVFVLLVTAVGDSLWRQATNLMQRPMEIFSILAATLPSATHFYLNYVPMQWGVHAMNMLRYINLSKFLLYRQICSEDKAREQAEPEDQDYYGMGSRTARHTLVAVIGIVLCTLSPIITVLVLINSGLIRMFYAYLVVYAESRKPDLGGVFWATSMVHLQQGLLIYIMLMTGVLMQRAATLGPAMVSGSSAVFWFLSYYRFTHKFRVESLPLKDLKAAQNCDNRVPTRTSYIQPELLPSPPIDTSTPGHWLSQAQEAMKA